MGNFSRITFDPAKGYTAVRLQQGVPLVDADWNELQDVTRNELYDALSLTQPNAVANGVQILGVANNDIQLSPGVLIVGGRPIRLVSVLRYSTQRYATPANAAADGVAVVPPLTTPGTARTDVVFVDVFEREVGSAEDPAIVNSAIGIETSVRVRREVVLRVAEGTSTPPAAPAGHTFLVLGFLARPASQAAIAPQMIDDVAPRGQVPATVDMSVAPFMFPFHNASFGAQPPWLHSFLVPGIGAQVLLKAANTSASGMAPVSFPHLARIRSMRVRGVNGSASISYAILRLRLDSSVSTVIVNEAVATPGSFDRTTTVPPAGLGIVDNTTFSYALTFSAATSTDTAQVNGIQIRYID